MANQYVNKVIIGSEVKLDLTQDDITPDKLAAGIKAHDKSGAPIVGSSTFDADTSDANAVAAELLKDKTAYVNGVKVTGTMPNNGAKTLNIINKSTPVTIPTGKADPGKHPQGYHDSGRYRHHVRLRGHEAAGEERNAHVCPAGGAA